MSEDRKSIPVTDLSPTEAKAFFLKETSYCNFDLPVYITFQKILEKVDGALENKNLSDCLKGEKKPSLCEGVNYLIINNKDGRYAWRPFQLLNPAIYVSMVNNITEKGNWKLIIDRLKDFQLNNQVQCLSIPLVSQSEEKDKAEQVSYWWHEVEQKSIELSLEYDYLIQTDITDCYGSIYTHTISWALHTKRTAKEKRNVKSLIGNIIDSHIQDMNYGQTNSLPQGSTLMDFIAEMVLGYSDQLLSKRIKKLGIKNYQILRYRDDYRIFTNNPPEGALILKNLTEIMIDLGLKLNPSKTFSSNHVIKDSIKKDKLEWVFREHKATSLERQLLIIHDHAVHYPNSGSLAVALLGFFEKIEQKSELKVPVLPLISIATDIAYNNPRTYPVITAIISKLLFQIETDKKKELVKRIINKFKKLPNTVYMNIWLQRVALILEESIGFENEMCKIVDGEKEALWNNEWIGAKKLKNAMQSKLIVDREMIKTLKPVVERTEISLFIKRVMEPSS
ncbi:MAG: RNA-directed DNA polymerase [Spirochaetia bacterium]|nr:RNA-directed DNA polymerase [Spirochaetia bacterium]MCF7945381.1 RNA-directed DNA polymerase [Spirochaetia bacterium]